MRCRTGLLLFGCVLAAGCDSKVEETSAPHCIVVDELLLRLDGVNEDAGMRDSFQDIIQQLPQETEEEVVERIRARTRVEGGRMLATEAAARDWVALLLLSRKAETRTTKEYRYCAGDFDFGNGSAWRWHYSLSNEDDGPVLRILNAQVVASDLVVSSAPAAASTPIVAALDADVGASTALQNGAANAVAESQEDLAQPATQIATNTTASEGELALAAREELDRAKAEAATARAEAQAVREQTEHDRNQRLAEDQAAQQQATEQQAANEQPSPDFEYERRRGECPGGFIGKSCRHNVREQVCAGRWVSNPGPGETVCKR